jgi:hypothetical protein
MYPRRGYGAPKSLRSLPNPRLGVAPYSTVVPVLVPEQYQTSRPPTIYPPCCLSTGFTLPQTRHVNSGRGRWGLATARQAGRPRSVPYAADPLQRIYPANFCRLRAR